MDDEEMADFAKIANDLQDIVNLIEVVQSKLDKAAEEVNHILIHIEEKNGEDIGFDREEDTS